MALDISDAFPGRSGTPAAGRPFGSFQNRTTPTSQDGTYLRQDWTNDIYGFLHRLLVEVGATPSGTPDDTVNGQYYDAFVQLVEGLVEAGGVQPGQISNFAMVTAPSGYLKANGAAVSRTIYANLFAAIGTTWGAGDGVTTFNLPDFRGEFLRGWDDGRGLDPGRVFGTLQGSQNLSHNHVASSTSAGSHGHSGTALSAGSHTHTGSANSAGAHTHGYIAAQINGGVGLTANANTATLAQTDSAGAHTHTLTVNAGGAHTHTLSIVAAGAHTHPIIVNADGGSEARPRNQTVLVCIKF